MVPWPRYDLPEYEHAREQLHLLQDLGCDQGQGYFFAKPASPYDSDETNFQVDKALFRSPPQLKSQ
ncbi:hypothetical protein GCM10027567_20920 [Spongiibacter taiwanensis]